MSDKPIGLVNAIQQVTQEDATKLAERIGALERELATLKQVRRLVETMLHGPTPRQPPRRKSAKATPDGPSLAELAYDVIAANGPGTAGEIVRKLAAAGRETTPQAVGVTLCKSPWFERLPDGRWSIAINGKG